MSNGWHRARLALPAGLVLAAAAAGCGTSSQPAGGPSPSSPLPSLSFSAPSAGALTVIQRLALAARYLTVAKPANAQLDHEVDGYGDEEKDDLAAARRDLLDEVATERAFDAAVLRIAFPPAIEVQVQALVAANNARIALTTRQAQAGSLAAMRAMDSQHKAADAAVEAPVRVIRRDLGLPPPDTD